MTVNTTFRPEELTEEKDIWDIFIKAIKIPQKPYSKYALFAVCLGLVLFVVLTNASTEVIKNKVYDIASSGFNFTGSILGFLIAGFAISATSNKELFMLMATKFEPDTGLSYLKYTYGAFMVVFVWYTGFTLVCVLIKLFGFNGLFSMLLKPFPSITLVFTKIALVILGTWFFYLVLLLLSFIFNVYYILMSTIRWEFEKNLHSKASKDNNKDSLQ